VIAYDIFGERTPNMRQNVHLLAQTGFTVCMPDFFRGHSASDLGELNPEKIGAFIKDQYAFDLGI
jgi:dienelactone hydrolase